MKVLAAAVLVMALVGTPVQVVFTAPSALRSAFPYRAMSDVVADVTEVTPGSCQGEFGAVMVAAVPTRFMVFYIGDRRLVVGEWTSAETYNQGPPPFLWIGTASEEGVLHMEPRVPYNPVAHGDTPCRLLYPEKYL